MVMVFLLGNTDKLDVGGGLVRGLFLETGKVAVGETARVWLDDRRCLKGVVCWADAFGFKFDVSLETEKQ